MTELDEWQRELEREAHDQDRRANRAVSRTIETLRLRAWVSAPRDTGELRDSIKSEVNGLEGEVYTDTVQGLMQEVGTTRHPPQPFLLVHEKAMERRLQEELEREGWNP